MTEITMRKFGQVFMNEDIHRIFCALIRTNSTIHLPLDISVFPELDGLEDTLQQISSLSDVDEPSVNLTEIAMILDNAFRWTIPSYPQPEINDESAPGEREIIHSARKQAQEASSMVAVADGSGNIKYISAGDAGNPGHLYIVDPITGLLQLMRLPVMSRDIDWEAISLLDDGPDSITLALMNNKGYFSYRTCPGTISPITNMPIKPTKAEKKTWLKGNPGLMQVKIQKNRTALPAESETIASDFHSPVLLDFRKLPKNIASPIDDIVGAKLKKKLKARFTCEAMAIMPDKEHCVYLAKKKTIAVDYKVGKKISKWSRKKFDNNRVLEMCLGNIFLGKIHKSSRRKVVNIASLHTKVHNYLGKRCAWAAVPTDACIYNNDLFVLCHKEKSHPRIVQLDLDFNVTSVYQITNGYIKPEGLYVSNKGIFLADEGTLDRGNEYNRGSETFFTHINWSQVRKFEVFPATVPGVTSELANISELSIDESVKGITALVHFLTDFNYLTGVAVSLHRLKSKKTGAKVSRLQSFDIEVEAVYRRAMMTLDHYISQLEANEQISGPYINASEAFHDRVEIFIQKFPKSVLKARKKFEKILKKRKKEIKSSGMICGLVGSTGEDVSVVATDIESDITGSIGSILSSVFSTEILQIELDLLGDPGNPSSMVCNIDTGGSLSQLQAGLDRELSQANNDLERELSNARKNLYYTLTLHKTAKL